VPLHGRALARSPVLPSMGRPDVYTMSVSSRPPPAQPPPAQLLGPPRRKTGKVMMVCSLLSTVDRPSSASLGCAVRCLLGGLECRGCARFILGVHCLRANPFPSIPPAPPRSLRSNFARHHPLPYAHPTAPNSTNAKRGDEREALRIHLIPVRAVTMWFGATDAHSPRDPQIRGGDGRCAGSQPVARGL
jgi:hypothetical protein